MSVHDLQTLFHPTSIGVIGGSDRPDTPGHKVLRNLVEGRFSGPIYAVNPKRVAMEGVCWAESIGDLAAAPDLAVIATPSATMPGILEELGALGTRLAICITNGLDDADARERVLAAARTHGIRLLGPGSLGAIMPHARLNASVAPRDAVPGRIAFVSQSGALVAAMLDWAAARGIGFSGIASVGDMADVDLADLIDAFDADPHTDAILLYVETVTDAASFMSAARAASHNKPVVAVKGGRAATASDDAYAAAFRRAGIILVETLDELFDAAQMLCRYRPTCGKRIGLVSNSRSAATLAADGLAAQGAILPPLSADAIEGLDRKLSQGWSRQNPIDVLDDARPERFAVAIDALAAEDGIDAILVIHCPTANAPGREFAATTVAHALPLKMTKPVIACWLGDLNAASVTWEFESAGVPLFAKLGDAVRGIGHLLRASEAREALMRVPAGLNVPQSDRERGRAIVAQARYEGRTVLSAREAADLAAAYGIPTVTRRFAATADALASAASGIAAPYAVKLLSPDVPHKSEAGAVTLNVPGHDALNNVAASMVEQVRRHVPGARIEGFALEPMIHLPHGRELQIGLVNDPAFGLLVRFGAGGMAAELLADRTLELPPLDDALARDMIQRTRVARLLAGYGDVPAANLDTLVRILNAVSAIAADVPDIAELDINPLLLGQSDAIALDIGARLTAQPAMPHLAIRPYPAQWTADITTRGGIVMHVRPVRPDDEAVLADLFHHVSPEDLRFRFLTGVREVGRDRLVAMTRVDYRRTMHFLAFEGARCIASALLACDPDRERAELAVTVRQDCRDKGVSWSLIEHVMRYAAAEGIKTIESVESRDNCAALALEREAGFDLEPVEGSSTEVLVRRTIA